MTNGELSRGLTSFSIHAQAMHTLETGPFLPYRAAALWDMQAGREFFGVYTNLHSAALDRVRRCIMYTTGSSVQFVEPRDLVMPRTNLAILGFT